MIERVISGGQTGGDQAGWRAAKAIGIATGGWMPRGFLTEDGPRPEFADLYGALEHLSPTYPPRTRDNVIDSFVTLWFGDPRSPGGRLTLGYAQARGKFTYVIETPGSEWTPAAIARHVANAFEQQEHFPRSLRGVGQTLNVAGNRESSAPGIGEWVERYLAEVFRLMAESGTGE